MNVGVGSEVNFEFEAGYEDCNYMEYWYNYTPSASWTSGSPSIASIQSTGLVKGVSGGTASISASYSGYTYSFNGSYCNQNPPVPGGASGTASVPPIKYVSVYSNSCSTLQCTVGVYNFTTPDSVLYYQVLDTNKSPVTLAGMTADEYNTNYSCSQGCNTYAPTDGYWLTDIHGRCVGADYIATCSLTCYDGGTCNASWNQSFNVNANSFGYTVSVINGLLTGSHNVNSTSCGTCPSVVPTP
jgi:hypothetical protein